MQSNYYIQPDEINQYLPVSMRKVMAKCSLLLLSFVGFCGGLFLVLYGIFLHQGDYSLVGTLEIGIGCALFLGAIVFWVVESLTKENAAYFIRRAWIYRNVRRRYLYHIGARRHEVVVGAVTDRENDCFVINLQRPGRAGKFPKQYTPDGWQFFFAGERAFKIFVRVVDRWGQSIEMTIENLLWLTLEHFPNVTGPFGASWTLMIDRLFRHQRELEYSRSDREKERNQSEWQLVVVARAIAKTPRFCKGPVGAKIVRDIGKHLLERGRLKEMGFVSELQGYANAVPEETMRA